MNFVIVRRDYDMKRDIFDVARILKELELLSRGNGNTG